MASNIECSVDQLTSAIQGVLKDYNKVIVDGTKEAARKSMKELVKETKQTAPVGHRRKKHYKDSITSKKTWENSMGAEYLWYVKGSDYRLSHILENGHALRQGGRVSGTHFIKKATDRIVKEFVSKVEELIRNG